MIEQFEKVINKAIEPQTLKRLRVMLVQEKEIQNVKYPAVFYNIVSSRVINNSRDDYYVIDEIQALAIKRAGKDYFADFDELYEKIISIEKYTLEPTIFETGKLFKLTNVSNSVGDDNLQGLIAIRFNVELHKNIKRSV